MVDSSIKNSKIYDNILISICICTYRRNDLLGQCLSSLLNLNFFENYEIIVVDNDSSELARFVAEAFKEIFNSKGIPFLYSVEVCQGIASARNHAVSLAKGRYIAFIDDDEVADSQWLSHLYKTMLEFEADGVWGPVIPIFPKDFPVWQKSFFSRERFYTGTVMNKKTKGTGNALVKRECLLERKGPFDIALNRVGGSDSDLFNWLTERKKNFVWCDEAIVTEFQPIERSKIRWHLVRTYRGGWGFAYQKVKFMGRFKSIWIILGWVFLATGKNLILSLRYCDLRVVALCWLRIMSTQSGKLGFLLNMKVEEYKDLSCQ
ncbi:MAG: glycosyltransferase family 2 protein [Desulfomicrobium sp.]